MPSTIPPPLPPPYTVRYGGVFVAHALLSALAWALLAPVSHVLARATPGSFSVHRAAMLLAALLTLATYALALRYASAAPAQHARLAAAVCLAALLQSAAAALRPRAPASPWTPAWARAHRAFGAAVMALAFFVVAHSLDVFRVDGWLYAVIVAMLAVGACAVAVTILTGLVQWWGSNSERASDDAGKTVLLEEEEEEKEEEEEESGV